MGQTHKGFFRPKNPEKYKGDPRNIVYRSSWERIMMNWLDTREDVLDWSSEEKAIWYYEPVAKKRRRYFPDFMIRYKNKDGCVITELIEVKPKAQVLGPPENPKRRTKAWANQVMTYITNQAKWEAARNICEDRGWSFRVITEDQLGLSK